MSVPAQPAPALAGLSPSALAAVEAAAPPTAVATRLSVRRADLNVLAGSTASVAGALLASPPAGMRRPAGSAIPAPEGGAPSPGVGVPLPGGAPSARPAGVAGRIVVLQAHTRRGWRTLAGTRTGAHGRYRLRYRARRLGSTWLRVSFAGAPGERGSHRAAGRLDVYRVVVVSWYGGGGGLACGGWLTSATLGVANRTLPCGTLVTLRYAGHTVRAPVVDRGPYVAGREFDLTEATKNALGFEEGVGEVWATR